MALSEKDKEWVRATITSTVDPLHPHGFKRMLSLMKEYGSLGTYLGLIAALFYFAVTQHSAAVTRAVEESKFEQKTNDRLDAIEASLLQLQAATNPSKVLSELSKLNSDQLSKNLPALKAVTSQPLNTVKATESQISDLSSQLLSVSNTSQDYWPTVASYISFASGSLAQTAPPPASQANYLTNVSGLEVASNNAYSLDGLIQNVVFVKSRIILQPNVTLRNVRFVGCIFEFAAPEIEPSAPLKAASRILLAEGFANATVSGI